MCYPPKYRPYVPPLSPETLPPQRNAWKLYTSPCPFLPTRRHQLEFPTTQCPSDAPKQPFQSTAKLPTLCLPSLLSFAAPYPILPCLALVFLALPSPGHSFKPY